MVEGPVIARRTATLPNPKLRDTQLIYTTLCFTNCCVHPNVLNLYAQVLAKPTDIAFCVTVVFYRSSECNVVNYRI